MIGILIVGRYFVTLITNAGELKGLETEDKALADKVVDALNDAIVNH